MAGQHTAPGRGLRYEESKRLAADCDPAVRARLGARSDVRPEILYYLAEDAEAQVRRQIAANERTSIHADRLLAEDADEQVRTRLAAKVARLAPELGGAERARVREQALQVLEMLARDQAVAVRRVLAEALKDVAHAPEAVIRRLARDVEADVALPVLEFSPLLSDGELLEIIEGGCLPDHLIAIARRNGVGEAVSEAIVGRDAEAAVTALLQNASAQIREETLDGLAERAREVPAWQEPLVRRPRLPPGAARRLAGFVGERLLAILEARTDLPAETARAVAREVERRLGTGEAGEEAAPTAGEEAAAAAAELDEADIAAALGRGEQGLVVAALAAHSGLPGETVERVLAARSPRGVTALAWKANLSVRFAVQLQLRLGGITPAQVLHPRGGTDYPLSPEDMDWQLDFFRSLGG